MQRFLQFKLKTNSLFIRLLVSFLVVIGLLISFNFYSFSFFRDNIHNEIIEYNNANLKNTTEGFEKHFQLLNNLVLGLYINDNVQLLLNNKNIDYYTSRQVNRDVQNVMSTPLLFMDNLVLYFKDSSLILDKGGSTNAETMFSKFYKTDVYPYDFWKRQFTESYSFQIYPAADFSEITFENASSSKGKLFPLIIKNKIFPDFYITAFVDAEKLIHAYHRSINENFYILDQQGTRIFSSNLTNERELPQFEGNENYTKHADYYYFYKKGDFTGLTYVNIIPVNNISSQIDRLNHALILLFIAAIAVSIIASIFFSMQIHNPVKQIIHSLKHFNNREPVRSRIKEFQDIHSDLSNKNSLLRNYAYTNKLKKINSNFHELKDFIVGNKQFIVILFQFTFKNRFHTEFDADTDRAINFIREHISRTLLEKYIDANTFQIESNQILSLIFAENSEAELVESLEQLKRVLDLDRDFYYLTIAVSTVHKHSSEFNTAYEQVIKHIQQRKLSDETQIIWGQENRTAAYALTSTLEKEFEMYLQSGNDSEIIRFIHRLFSMMHKKNAVAADYHQIAEQLCKKAIRTVTEKNLYQELNYSVDKLSDILTDCHNVSQLEQFLEQLLSHSADLIKQTKEARDVITSFVYEYFENNYSEDISLDSVAEKMNITGGYLSSYFKEKTGKNFIDYLNEVRINKAKEILLQSNMKIQDIALRVGYQNMNSFNRMFKKFS
ncbi:MAG: AraC family transcriptional regulator, partial [Paenibacillus sp.]|nr:AraC family transcriptional regulator [Paenibacillus sp.]